MHALPGWAALRGRLLALLLLGAVPLAVTAGVVAWQDYRSAVSRAERDILLLSEAISARHRAAIEEVWQELAAIAADPALLGDSAACDRMLRGVLLLRSGRYLGLAVVDADGRPRCSAFPDQASARALSGPPEASEWFRIVKTTRAFTISAGRDPGPRGDILIGTAYPVMDHEQFAGAAAAVLRVDWLTRPRGSDNRFDFWLVDGTGALIAGPKSSAAALPPAPALAQLVAAEPELAMRRAVSGHRCFYSVADLGGGLRLLLAQDANPNIAEARKLLFLRLLGLGLLLVIGVAAASFGASLALVRPIERLTAAVARWRAGVPFEPGKLDRLPTELQGLAGAFGHATEALGRREGQLRRALEKQELLAQEIHHRVKNNLQIVASLLNLQASRIRQPEAKAEFQSARDRVQALATLHRHLYLQGELQTINMRSFLTELCGQLFQALGPRAVDRIRLDIQAADLGIASDQAVPLALIVTETVGNAVKYAFPGNRPGRISVRLTTEADQAKLVIQDDGVGLPAGRSETDTGVRDGIGLKLVRGLVRQLGASLIVEEGNGTRYEVTMRLDPRRMEPGGLEEPAPTADWG